MCPKEGKRGAFCEYEIPGQEIWEIDGTEYKGCPYEVVTRKSAGFLRAFKFYRVGFLPNNGSWLNQPAKLLDAFGVIEKTLDEIKAEKEKRRKAFTK